MGRVPLVLFLMFTASVLTACAPEEPTPPAPATEQAEDAVRDAGDAAREAMKKAGDALRLLSGKPEPEEVAPPPAPVVPAGSTEAPAPAPGNVIAPVPDETQQVESELGVQRDASVATQEATERLVEATRRAAERMRNAGKGVVDVFRKDGDTPPPDTNAAPTPSSE